MSSSLWRNPRRATGGHRSTGNAASRWFPLVVKLGWENVPHKPVWTMLSLLLIAVPVTLILTLVGLSERFINDSRKRSAGVGADILFKPPNANVISFSTATMPAKIVDLLAKEPHVIQAMGTV